MSSRRIEIFSQYYAEIRRDIFKFCKALGFKPTWQQRQLLEAIQRGEKRIAVRSGQGPGKTITSAVIGLWLLILNRNAKLLVVAPTLTQAKDVWLAQAKKLIHSDKADPALRFFYEFTATGIKVMGRAQNEWGALLHTGSTDSEKGQGQHEVNMHIIFEEASGIPRPIVEQYEGTLKNPNAVFMQIGNPNTRSCAFFDCFNLQKHKWHTLAWNAEETPESIWFSQQTNLDLAEKYGRDSDVYRVRVLGEFPHTDPSCIISYEEIQGCLDSDRIALSGMLDEKGRLPRQFGMDFARFGADENVFYMRQGYAVRKWDFFNNIEPGDMVEKCFNLQDMAGWTNDETLYVPDAGGMGQGCMRDFYKANKQVLEFHSAGRALKSREFDNKMTEAYFEIKKLAKEGKLWLPKDPKLISQLTGRTYAITKKGLPCIESKDDYKKRGNDSPDRAEAFVMAFYPCMGLSRVS